MRDRDHVQAIDLLALLRVKTEGNRTDQESHLLEEMLYDLQLRFVRAAKALRVTLPARKGVIASHLNLTHEHFSRILHELIEARLIAVDGPQVTIPDIARLRGYGA